MIGTIPTIEIWMIGICKVPTVEIYVDDWDDTVPTIEIYLDDRDDMVPTIEI
jgi:hypothetical protein